MLGRSIIDVNYLTRQLVARDIEKEKSEWHIIFIDFIIKTNNYCDGYKEVVI